VARLRECHDARGDLRPSGEKYEVVSSRKAGRRKFVNEPLLRASDKGLGFAGVERDPVGANGIGAQKHDFGPLDVLLCCITAPCKRLSDEPLLGLRVMEIPVRICQTRMFRVRQEIHPGIQMLEFVH
jgi:hypothetical protein